MKPVQLFSLESHQGPYDKWPLHTRLFANGVDTDQKVSGYVIEAAYKCETGYLLITSYDCLFEEANTFLLLNDRFKTIASKSLGGMYSTFLLEAHKPLSANSLALDYGDGLTYTLAVERSILGGFKLRLARDKT